MAVSAVTIYVNSGAAATSFTSASFTPAANMLLFAFLNARTGASAIPTLSDTSSPTLTWSTISGSVLAVGAGNLKTASYVTMTGASPGAMTATVTSAAALGCSLMIFGFTGAANDVTNIGIATDTAGDPAPSNSAMAALSTGVCWNAQNAGASPTASPTAQGYTQQINAAPATNIRHTLYTDATSPANAVSWTTTGTDSIGILLEIKEAGAAPAGFKRSFGTIIG